MKLNFENSNKIVDFCWVARGGRLLEIIFYIEFILLLQLLIDFFGIKENSVLIQRWQKIIIFFRKRVIMYYLTDGMGLLKNETDAL